MDKRKNQSSNSQPSRLSNHGRRGFSVSLDLAAVIAVGAALLYVAGWSFAYRYFGRFHIGLPALDLPREYFFMYGFWVVREHLLPVVCLLTGGAALWVARERFRTHLPRLVPWLVCLVPFLLLGLFAGSYTLGTRTADTRFLEQKSNDYPAYPRVRVRLLPQSDPEMAAMGHRLAAGCHRLLLQNKDKLFLFRSLKAVPAATLPLIVIPMSQVRSIKALPHYRSCET